MKPSNRSWGLTWTAVFALAFAFAVGGVGCAGVSQLVGYNEELIPPNAKIERIISSDETWKTFALSEPLGNPRAKSNVKRRWAMPNYGTSDWRPALTGEVEEGDLSRFEGSKWMWFPEERFQFGATNSMPDNRRVVHFRREFYNDRVTTDIEKAYLDIMTSGSVSIRVFVNGALVKLSGREEYERIRRQGQGNVPRTAIGRGGQTQLYGGVPDLSPRRYDIRNHLRVGKNVIGIEATAHIENDVGGRPVPNYVRSGVIARVVIE